MPASPTLWRLRKKRHKFQARLYSKTLARKKEERERGKGKKKRNVKRKIFHTLIIFKYALTSENMFP